ncbi:hypothetical protein PHYPSEUDO_004958 [Phytophthora pseudosyringae]|uniref:Uncharacterized protein n=1 Tax=Phytophthora pseudosyringae TaxID=221518 RepID=A0A8T1WHI4_9STRA|nr:hypothetical protein PHYPSEUDO_004958 [Phytophthora pseudosyringae]
MPDEELRAYWLGRGLPTDVYGDFSKLPMKLCIGDLLCCGEMLANGSMSTVTDTVERLTGRKPLGYKENLLQYKEIFPKNHVKGQSTCFVLGLQLRAGPDGTLGSGSGGCRKTREEMDQALLRIATLEKLSVLAAWSPRKT